jgi:hypothetical protein
VGERVFKAVPMTDGRLALTLADTPGGRVAVTPGTVDPVETVTDLPDNEQFATSVSLSGGRLAASWERRDDVTTAPADGTGSWASTFPAPGFASSGSKGVQLAGDVLLTDAGNGGSAGEKYRLSWPGGSRDLTGNAVWLGHGGQYVERISFSHSGTIEVSDARTGAVAATYTGYDTRPVDGTWVWTPPDQAGSMTGTDLSGVEAQRQAQVPTDCRGRQLLDVRGRWALLRCPTRLVVVDLDGVITDRTLPSGSASLADGFVAAYEATTTPWGDANLAHVTDLYTGDSRAYGPMHTGVSVNDDGGPDLAYLDDRQHVRHVDLDWLSDAAKGPSMLSAPNNLEAVASTTPHSDTWSWAWSRAVSYDVRQGDRTGTTWTLPAQWQGLDSSTVTTTIDPGQGACFSARAHDSQGHVSLWSPAVCQYVDGAAPVLQSGPVPAPLVAAASPQTLPLSWTWTDPSSGLPGTAGIATYDVRRGDRLGGSWTQPPSWQGLTTASVTATVDANTGACFSARATDRVGNTSDWSDPVCQYVDGTAPRITATTGSTAYPAALRAPVTFSASGSDDQQVASYDVERSNAPRSRGLGAWTRVVDNGPRAAVTTGAQTPGSEDCFRSRVRDQAGNVSGWSNPRCTTAAVDERGFSRGGHTAFYRSSAAIGGTYMGLWGKGSSATLASQTGHTLALWVFRGPGLGLADVYAGSRRVARIDFRAASSRRMLVLIPVSKGFSGSVKLVVLDRRTVRVDAIAVAR